ncbi:MAG: cysteine dioxygenase [Sphingomonadaceae bacterium]
MPLSHTEEALSPRLADFVAGLTALVDAGAPEARIVTDAAALLRTLLAHDDWLAPQYAQPDPQYYRQYLLYRDPAARFSVVSFVWGPGQQTPLHNHTVWGLVGILRGAEIAQEYRPDAHGRLQPYGAPQRLEPGTVCAVSPTLGDIHQVFNAYADRVSIGVHVYGADIGAIDREVFTLDGARKPFRSGYAAPA